MKSLFAFFVLFTTLGYTSFAYADSQKLILDMHEQGCTNT